MTIYRHPRSWSIRLAIGVAAVLTVLGALLTLSINEGQIFATLLFALFALGIGVPVGWSISHIAREIEVTDRAITARPFLGPRRTLQWSEIDSMERFAAFTLDIPRPDIYRLLSFRRGGIAFTSRIEGFEELLEVVRSRTVSQKPLREPVWWRKLVFRGWP